MVHRLQMVYDFAECLELRALGTECLPPESNMVWVLIPHYNPSIVG